MAYIRNRPLRNDPEVKVKEEPEELEEDPIDIYHEMNIVSLAGDEIAFCQVCESTEDLIDIYSDGNYQEELGRMIDNQDEKLVNLLKFICKDCGRKVKEIMEFRKQYENTYRKLSERMNCIQNKTENVVYQELFIVTSFPDEPKLEEEREETWNSGNFALQDNTGYSRDQYTYKEHMKCDYCGKTFKLKANLEQHIVTHIKSRDVQMDLQLQTKLHICTKCEYKTDKIFNFKRHTIIHTGERPYKCTQCSKMYCDIRDLKSHEVKCGKSYSHIGPNKEKRGKEKSFKLKPLLQQHIDTGKKSKKKQKDLQLKAKLHICSECEYKTNNILFFKRHLMMHSGEKPYKCTQCPKIYCDLKNLKSHEALHSITKSHSPIGPNVMPENLSKTELHIVRKYTKKQKGLHICTECDYTTYKLFNFKRHTMMHTGEKPYKCTHCKHAFTDLYTLNRHKMTHKVKKQDYTCTYCSKTFKIAAALKAHLNIHLK